MSIFLKYEMNKIDNYNPVKLGFVIPTRNRPDELRECLQSIIAEIQDYSFPIYVSDNASDPSKNVESVIIEMKKLYPHIYWHQFSKNVGFDRNVLHVIQMAQSEFIWLFGDDDILLPNAVHKLLSFLENHKEKPVCFIVNWQQRSDDFQTIRRNNCLGIIEDEITNDFNRILTQYGSFALSFVSCLVISREKINIFEYEKYLGSDLVHSFIFLEIATMGNIVLVADTLLWQRVAVSNWSFIDSAARILIVEMLKFMLLLPSSYERQKFSKLLSGTNSHFEGKFKNRYINISALYSNGHLNSKNLKDLAKISLHLRWYIMAVFCMFLYLMPSFALQKFYLFFKRLKYF